jgi:hypothetical protein
VFGESDCSWFMGDDTLVGHVVDCAIVVSVGFQILNNFVILLRFSTIDMCSKIGMPNFTNETLIGVLGRWKNHR